MFAYHLRPLSGYLIFLVLLFLTLSFFSARSRSSSILLALPYRFRNLFYPPSFALSSLTAFSHNRHLSLIFSTLPLYLRWSFFRTLFSLLSSAKSPLNFSFLSLTFSCSPTTFNSRNFSHTHPLFLSLHLSPDQNSTLSFQFPLSLSQSCSLYPSLIKFSSRSISRVVNPNF